MRRLIKLLFISSVVGVGYVAYSRGYIPQERLPAWSLLKWNGLPKETFKTTLPIQRNVVHKKVFAGTLVPSKEIQLEAHIRGVIDKLYVSVGDCVEKGAAVARIKISPNTQSMEKAESNVRIAAITLAETRKKYLRNKQLFDKKMLAKEAYEVSLASWKEAQERYLSATKQLEIIQSGYTKSQGFSANVVKATSRGTILDLPVKEGGPVKGTSDQTNGTVVAVIGDMTDFLFRAQVSELDVVHLRKGIAFDIVLNASKADKFQVKLTKIAPKANEEAAKKGEVKFDIEGFVLHQKKSNTILRSGYVALAEIVLEQANNVWTIPEKLIQMEGNDCFVWCLEGGKKVKKNVVLGLSDGFYAAIKSGVTATDQLIVEE
ncbi:MAG: efflux RND transporter periplasmic adaptor subunit [Amoebophilaceae bacterium]|nr:efflux RND transporter periplasmic adaptor subunit [Amoebophilaceae bacterium]